ncbi:hypothetical protein BpHYR1_039024 [Brachionus plicatilis]|uniref:Uncharacterized protein n=1 Tax=Brachionus plicatilis TaxID=10195 RepID=A0A3M7RMT9_BRAPC|nr:hypothetical protein BpHYR1_039024 [Brachionus plicatilis]
MRNSCVQYFQVIWHKSVFNRWRTDKTNSSAASIHSMIRNIPSRKWILVTICKYNVWRALLNSQII